MELQQFEQYILALPKEYVINESHFDFLMELDTFSHSIEFETFVLYVCENTLTYWDGQGGFVLQHAEIIRSTSSFIINYPEGTITIKL